MRLLPSLSVAESVVLNGVPDSKVSRNAEGSERQNLATNLSKQNEYRVLITKKNEKYYWSTRKNRELIHTTSGAIHIFIEPGGAGYVEVFDNHVVPKSMRPPGKRFFYKEHLRLMLVNITYWGQSNEFNP